MANTIKRVKNERPGRKKWTDEQKKLRRRLGLNARKKLRV